MKHGGARSTSARVNAAFRAFRQEEEIEDDFEENSMGESEHTRFGFGPPRSAAPPTGVAAAPAPAPAPPPPPPAVVAGPDEDDFLLDADAALAAIAAAEEKLRRDGTLVAPSPPPPPARSLAATQKQPTISSFFRNAQTGKAPPRIRVRPPPQPGFPGGTTEAAAGTPAAATAAAAAPASPKRGRTGRTTPPFPPAELDPLPEVDSVAAQTWIYPVNYEKREYQFAIVREALFTNTLVCLPTGLGKTFIAAVVMLNFYRWFPNGKVLFIAPTRPLVAQQIEACHSVVGIPPDDQCELTGQTSPEDRAVLWGDKRVFFLTPQVIANDIEKSALSCNHASLLCGWVCKTTTPSAAANCSPNIVNRDMPCSSCAVYCVR